MAPNNNMIKVEVCAGSVASSVAAMRAGADRIELCSALSEGGTTPSIGMVKGVLQAVSIPVFPIIRPRGGDFLYGEQEVEVMLEDIHAFRHLGVQGFSLGCLTREGRLDRVLNTRLIEACGGLPVTLHRAFDRTANLLEELEVAIDLGFSRILTSGGAISAPRGSELLARLVTQAGDRIIIMAGAGVRPDNATKLVQECGVRELHGTFSQLIKSEMNYRTPHFPENYSEEVGEYDYRESSEGVIHSLIQSIKGL